MVTQTIELQEQLDAILPYMLPVAVTALAYWLLKKREWSPIQVILLLVVMGFAGGALGIFG
jgi:mannose/fructose/N-acetylgalactosamine-specific phosphotransferase system component IID